MPGRTREELRNAALDRERHRDPWLSRTPDKRSLKLRLVPEKVQNPWLMW